MDQSKLDKFSLNQLKQKQNFAKTNRTQTQFSKLSFNNPNSFLNNVSQRQIKQISTPFMRVGALQQNQSKQNNNSNVNQQNESLITFIKSKALNNFSKQNLQTNPNNNNIEANNSLNSTAISKRAGLEYDSNNNNSSEQFSFIDKEQAIEIENEEKKKKKGDLLETLEIIENFQKDTESQDKRDYQLQNTFEHINRYMQKDLKANEIYMDLTGPVEEKSNFEVVKNRLVSFKSIKYPQLLQKEYESMYPSEQNEGNVDLRNLMKSQKGFLKQINCVYTTIHNTLFLWRYAPADMTLNSSKILFYKGGDMNIQNNNNQQDPFDEFENEVQSRERFEKQSQKQQQGKVVLKQEMGAMITAVGFIENSFVAHQQVIENVLIVAYPHNIKFYALTVMEEKIEIEDLEISIPTNGYQIDIVEVSKEGRIFLGTSTGFIKEILNTTLTFEVFGKQIERLNRLTEQYNIGKRVITTEGVGVLRRLRKDFVSQISGKQSKIKQIKIDELRGLMYVLIETYQKQQLVNTQIDIYRLSTPIKSEQFKTPQQQQMNQQKKLIDEKLHKNAWDLAKQREQKDILDFVGTITQLDIFKFCQNSNNCSEIKNILDKPAMYLLEAIYAADFYEDSHYLHLIVMLKLGVRLYLELAPQKKTFSMRSIQTPNKLSNQISQKIQNVHQIKLPMQFYYYQPQDSAIPNPISKQKGSLSNQNFQFSYQSFYISKDQLIIGIQKNGLNQENSNELQNQIQIISKNQSIINRVQSQAYNLFRQVPCVANEGQEMIQCIDTQYGTLSTKHRNVHNGNGPIDGSESSKSSNNGGNYEQDQRKQFQDMIVTQLPKSMFVESSVQNLLKLKNKNNSENLQYIHNDFQSVYLKPQHFVFLSDITMHFQLQLRSVDVLYTLIKVLASVKGHGSLLNNIGEDYRQVNGGGNSALLENELYLFAEHYGLIETCSLLVQIIVHEDMEYYVGKEYAEELIQRYEEDNKLRQQKKSSLNNNNNPGNNNNNNQGVFLYNNPNTNIAHNNYQLLDPKTQTQLQTAIQSRLHKLFKNQGSETLLIEAAQKDVREICLEYLQFFGLFQVKDQQFQTQSVTIEQECYTAGIEGLYLYLSRVMAPICNKTLISPTKQSSYPSPNIDLDQLNCRKLIGLQCKNKEILNPQGSHIEQEKQRIKNIHLQKLKGYSHMINPFQQSQFEQFNQLIHNDQYNSNNNNSNSEFSYDYVFQSLHLLTSRILQSFELVSFFAFENPYQNTLNEFFQEDQNKMMLKNFLLEQSNRAFSSGNNNNNNSSSKQYNSQSYSLEYQQQSFYSDSLTLQRKSIEDFIMEKQATEFFLQPFCLLFTQQPQRDNQYIQNLLAIYLKNHFPAQQYISKIKAFSSQFSSFFSLGSNPKLCVQNLLDCSSEMSSQECKNQILHASEIIQNAILYFSSQELISYKYFFYQEEILEPYFVILLKKLETLSLYQKFLQTQLQHVTQDLSQVSTNGVNVLGYNNSFKLSVQAKQQNYQKCEFQVQQSYENLKNFINLLFKELIDSETTGQLDYYIANLAHNFQQITSNTFTSFLYKQNYLKAKSQNLNKVLKFKLNMTFEQKQSLIVNIMKLLEECEEQELHQKVISVLYENQLFNHIFKFNSKQVELFILEKLEGSGNPLQLYQILYDFYMYQKDHLQAFKIGFYKIAMYKEREGQNYLQVSAFDFEKRIIQAEKSILNLDIAIQEYRNQNLREQQKNDRILELEEYKITSKREIKIMKFQNQLINRLYNLYQNISENDPNKVNIQFQFQKLYNQVFDLQTLYTDFVTNNGIYDLEILLSDLDYTLNIIEIYNNLNNKSKFFFKEDIYQYLIESKFNQFVSNSEYNQNDFLQQLLLNGSNINLLFQQLETNPIFSWVYSLGTAEIEEYNWSQLYQLTIDSYNFEELNQLYNQYSADIQQYHRDIIYVLILITNCQLQEVVNKKNQGMNIDIRKKLSFFNELVPLMILFMEKVIAPSITEENRIILEKIFEILYDGQDILQKQQYLL